MATMTRRLQVLLDQDRFARLERVAEERQTTVAALVREALDRAYPPGSLPPDIAADRFLGRRPIELGTWEQARQDIDDSLERGLPG